MLPLDLLSISSRDGYLARAAPRYLTPRDEVWVRAVIDLFDGYVGRSVAERAAELPDRVRAIAREHGVYARAADGLAHVLARRFKSKVAGRLEPIEVRRVVFEEAGRDAVFDRVLVLQRAAMRLSAGAEETEHSLFADRPGARRIDALATPLPPVEAIEAYNLALVQGILLRSERVVVEVKEHLHAVVRFAKLAGLLCTCSFAESGTRLEVSGPLAILRHTTKYGFALASFFPAVLSTASFRLEARCLLRGAPIVVHIDATDRVARTHDLPRDADSAVERALARDVRRLGSAWTLTREANAIPVGNRLFFPDFTLRRGDELVLVEIVGFYTPEYLRSKLEARRAARGHKMIVCIDESLLCADGERTMEIVGRVVRYKRRVDARRLISAAEEMVSNAKV